MLADAYLAQAAESCACRAWTNCRRTRSAGAELNGVFLPYHRDENLARPWALPGTPGLTHRIGGLEKEDRTGNVSYDPANHEKMVRLRAEKIARAADSIPPLSIAGPADGDLLVLGWGSTQGAIRTAAERCRRNGLAIADAHLRHLNPLPANVGAVLAGYRKILVPELNAGQLASHLRSKFPGEFVTLSKLQGQPFHVGEIENKIRELMR